MSEGDQQTAAEMDAVSYMISEATKEGLQVEVVHLFNKISWTLSKLF